MRRSNLCQVEFLVWQKQLLEGFVLKCCYVFTLTETRKIHLSLGTESDKVCDSSFCPRELIPHT